MFFLEKFRVFIFFNANEVAPFSKCRHQERSAAARIVQDDITRICECPDEIASKFYRFLRRMPDRMLLLAFSTDIKLLLPPGLLFVYILLDGFILYGRFSRGDYMCLTGGCVGIEKSFLWKRPQRIIMRVDGTTIIIHLSKGRIVAEAGDTISLYLSPTTPIRQEDGAYLISRYYAVRAVPGLQPGREKA